MKTDSMIYCDDVSGSPRVDDGRQNALTWSFQRCLVHQTMTAVNADKRHTMTLTVTLQDGEDTRQLEDVYRSTLLILASRHTLPWTIKSYHSILG